LFELVKNDDDFAASLLADHAAGISGVSIVWKVSCEGFEGVQELEFGIVGGGFDEDGVDTAGEGREESSADER
jgi:hypothetical protein